MPHQGWRTQSVLQFTQNRKPKRVLVQCAMQSVSSRIWTRIAVSISYDDNHYTMGTSVYKFEKLSKRRRNMWRRSWWKDKVEITKDWVNDSKWRCRLISMTKEQTNALLLKPTNVYSGCHKFFKVIATFPLPVNLVMSLRPKKQMVSYENSCCKCKKLSHENWLCLDGFVSNRQKTRKEIKFRS